MGPVAVESIQESKLIWAIGPKKKKANFIFLIQVKK
jgi:hypothetical protein